MSVPAVRPALYKKKNGTYRSGRLAKAIELHNNAIVGTATDQNQLNLQCYQPVARPFFISKGGRLKSGYWNRANKSYTACIAGDTRTGGIAGAAADAYEFAMGLYDQLTNPAGLTDEQSEQAFALRAGESDLPIKKAALGGPYVWGAIAVLGLMAFSMRNKAS